MHVLNSSVRERDIYATLKIAKELAPKLGISRVTDTTKLDIIGIPVFASIRPNGNSLCVNAGKGFNAIEAEVGAYLESIEYYYAESLNSKIKNYICSIEQLVNNLPDAFTLEDFCLKWGKSANANDIIAYCFCEDILSNNIIKLPSQLVYAPFHENPGVDLYGTTTNGLASGNTVKEATIHAICELIERDIGTINDAKDKSVSVKIESIHNPEIRIMTGLIKDVGLELVLRTVPSNDFQLPYFEAYIIDEFTKDHITISKGQGLHVNKNISATRAITEAVQSRLSNIHGGRDDLIENYKNYSLIDDKKKITKEIALREKITNRTNEIDFSSIETYDIYKNINDLYTFLLKALFKNDINNIYRVVFTHENDQIQVVKIIIPKLESFENKLKRIGPRLFNLMKND